MQHPLKTGSTAIFIIYTRNHKISRRNEPSVWIFIQLFSLEHIELRGKCPKSSRPARRVLRPVLSSACPRFCCPIVLPSVRKRDRRQAIRSLRSIEICRKGRHSRAKKAPFSGCLKFSDLMPASKSFSIFSGGHFETISEQRRKVSNLRLSLTFSRVETVSGQVKRPRPFFFAWQKK